MFGGQPLQGHSIPKVYGAIEPTAVYVPLQAILGSEDAFKTATTEVFGPVQVTPGFMKLSTLISQLVLRWLVRMPGFLQPEVSSIWPELHAAPLCHG